MKFNIRHWVIAVLLFVDLCVAIGVYSTQTGINTTHIMVFSIMYLVLVLSSLFLYLMTKEKSAPTTVSSSSASVESATTAAVAVAPMSQSDPKVVKTNWLKVLKVQTNLVAMFTGGLVGFCIGLKV